MADTLPMGPNGVDPSALKPPAGFFRVAIPDGSYVDFPDGTPDSKVEEVLKADAASHQTNVAETQSTATPHLVAAGPAADPTKPNIIPGSTDNWAKMNEKQRAAYTDFVMHDAAYDPNAPIGSRGNPPVLLEGAEAPVGMSYFGHGGELNTEPNPGTPNEGLGFMDAAARPLLNVAQWGKDALVPIFGQANVDAIDRVGNRSLGLGDRTTEQVRQVWDDRKAAAAAQGQTPGLQGGIAGGVIGTYPLMVATRNPWLAGGIAGLSETKDPHDPVGATLDAATGAVGGKVADVGTRALGGMIAPRVNPMVRRLMDQKVELTPGQIQGGLAHRAEDATRSIYVLGDMVIARQAGAQASFNKAAAQTALTPIGTHLPDNIPAGHPSIEFAQGALSDAYDRVLPGVKARPDRAFVTDLQAANKDAMGLPRDQSRVFRKFMRDVVTPRIMRNNGTIDGATFKDLESAIGLRARTLRRSNDVFNHDLAGAFDDVQVALRELVGRQNPKAGPVISAINDGYANLVRVETAAQQAENGVFTPQQLRNVVTSNRFAGRKSAARGHARMQELANDASVIMHQTIPDSGTSARMLATGVAGSALFGQGLLHRSVEVNPWAAGLLAAGAVPYSSRTAGKVTASILTRRPGVAVTVRKGIDAVANSRVPASIGGGYSPISHRQQDVSQ